MPETTKLILVEGIPGSGKTTTARFVAEWLSEQGMEVALFLEGDWNHPADFESIARLDERQVAALKARFPREADLLQSRARHEENDWFFHYRQLEADHPELPGELIAALARYEIYELPVETYQRLVRQRWQRFGDTAAAANTVYVFECCFLQNPLTMMLGRHDEPRAAAQAFIQELAESVRPLEPRWLYLQPGDVRTTLAEVAQTRPPEWLEFVIAYHTRQGHGRTMGWQGFDGLVSFYQMRQAVELSLLPQLPFPGLLLARSDWESDRARIVRFLAETFLLEAGRGDTGRLEAEPGKRHE